MTSEKKRLQLNSLLNVYHGGIKSPEEDMRMICMTIEQYNRAKRKYRSLTWKDKRFLKKHLKPKMMRMLALRDSDNDGILDFRIKELGSFMANDPDADNDDISNLFDPRPQDHGPRRDSIVINDEDGDHLPDHLDWSNSRRFTFARKGQHYLIDKQSSIYNKYKVVLVETDFPFTVEIADMATDVLEIFGNYFHSDSFQANAKSITTANQYGVEPMDVLAEASPVNGQLIIYGDGIRNISESPKNLVAPFMVLVHEFSHAIQNAMDFPDNLEGLLKQNVHYAPENFAAYVNKIGWEIDVENQKNNLPDRGYVFTGEEPVAPEEIYKGAKLQNIAKVCAEGAEWDEEAMNIWEKYNLVMCYSTDSVREWHSEYVAVSILSSMYSRLEETQGSQAEGIIELAQEKMAVDFGAEGYDYNNADQDALDKINRDLGMSTRLIDRLNRKYLITPFAD